MQKRTFSLFIPIFLLLYIPLKIKILASNQGIWNSAGFSIDQQTLIQKEKRKAIWANNSFFMSSNKVQLLEPDGIKTGFSKEEESQLDATIQKNPKLYRQSKIKSFLKNPFFEYKEYNEAEDGPDGCFYRFYLTRQGDNISGIVKYQNPISGSVSFYSEKVNHNIGLDELKKWASQNATFKQSDQADKYFLHVLEIKGECISKNILEFKTNEIKIDNDYECIKFFFRGKLVGDRIQGVLIRRVRHNTTYEFYGNTIDKKMIFPDNPTPR